MKILIFEGIATSGKSTAIAGLIKKLPDSLKVGVCDEEKTHMPIKYITDDLCKVFLQELIADAISENNDLVIFDRLYLTQVFRSKASLKEYTNIEQILLPYSPLTVFFKVNEAAITDRITKAMNHRDPSWGEYVGTKGSTIKEQISYYIEQQKTLIDLLRQSSLPYQLYDTTDHEYESVIESIKQKVLLDL